MVKPSETNDLALVAMLAGDGLATASRLIAVNGLAAEGAARAGDMPTTFAKLSAIAKALDDAREIVALAQGRADR